MFSIYLYLLCFTTVYKGFCPLYSIPSGRYAVIMALREKSKRPRKEAFKDINLSRRASIITSLPLELRIEK
jgi:hypothetical protein